MLKRRRQNQRDSGAAKAGERRAPLKVSTTPAGYPDLLVLQRRPYDGQARDAVQKALASAGLRDFTLWEGTNGKRIFLELKTETEADVFEALEVAAKTWSDVGRKQRGLEGFEVLMITGTRARAGQFFLDAKNAPLLVEKKMSAPQFFLEQVQF